MPDTIFGPDGKIAFPPYGEMTNGLQDQLNANPSSPPEHFQPVEDWVAVRAQLFKSIQDTLWPIWNDATQDWEGSSRATMGAITMADLDLGAELRFGSLHQKPNAPNPPNPQLTHESFYEHEDDNEFLDLIDKYDQSITPAQKGALLQAYDKNAVRKFGTVLLQLKVVFQRSRPLQNTFLLKKRGVRPLRAISAGTPALPSGHTIQALLGIGAVMEGLLPFPEGSTLLPALQQLAVDIGDRRVYAGIHHPSDNIASWIAVSTISRYVFWKSDVRDLLLYAIKYKSELYNRVSKIAIYQPALERI